MSFEEKLEIAVKKRMDSFTFWVGVLGITLFTLQLKSLLVLLFIILMIAPEASFSGVVTKIVNWFKN